MEPRTVLCRMYHVRKQIGYQRRHGGYRNWQLPHALTFSLREQHFIGLKSCAEYENAGPKSHRATHCSAFDNVRLSTSQKHSNRNQHARRWTNEASETRLLITSDQALSKTACSCCNYSSTESTRACCQPSTCSYGDTTRRPAQCSGEIQESTQAGSAAAEGDLRASPKTPALARSKVAIMSATRKRRQAQQPELAADLRTLPNSESAAAATHSEGACRSSTRASAALLPGASRMGCRCHAFSASSALRIPFTAGQ